MKPGSFPLVPYRNQSLLSLLALLAAITVVTGCATSTVEKRKHERYAAYTELTAEQRQEVDAGRIKVGMTSDAVYIAWGKPSAILSGESSEGSTATWLYSSTYLQEHHYWSYRHTYYGRRGYASPYLASHYYPQSYVRAEVIFRGGKVREWRSLPAPGY